MFGVLLVMVVVVVIVALVDNDVLLVVILSDFVPLVALPTPIIISHRERMR
jgi:hypothetical protein